jgi:hypothetical protein
MNAAAFPNRKSCSSLIFCSRVRTSSASVGSLLAKRYTGLHPWRESTNFVFASSPLAACPPQDICLDSFACLAFNLILPGAILWTLIPESTF